MFSRSKQGPGGYQPDVNDPRPLVLSRTYKLVTLRSPYTSPVHMYRLRHNILQPEKEFYSPPDGFREHKILFSKSPYPDRPAAAVSETPLVITTLDAEEVVCPSMRGKQARQAVFHDAANNGARFVVKP